MIENLRALRSQNPAVELVASGAPRDRAAQDAIAQVQVEFFDANSCAHVLTGDAKTGFCNDIDYFLFPSLYPHETESLVMPEVLAAGIPIISHDHRYVGEVLGWGRGLIRAVSSFAAAAAEWILSRNWIKRRVTTRARAESAWEDAKGQIDLVLDGAAGTIPLAEKLA